MKKLSRNNYRLYVVCVGLLITNWVFLAQAMVMTRPEVSKENLDHYYQKGIEAIDNGKLLEGLPLLLIYLDNAETDPSIETLEKLSTAYLKAAYVYNVFNDYSTSVEFNRKSQEMAEKAGNDDMRAMALCNQFAPLYSSGQIEAADNVNELFYKISKDSLAIFGYTVNKACIKSSQGDINEAIALMNKSISIVERNSLPSDLISYPLSALTEYYFNRGDLHQSLETLRAYEANAIRGNLQRQPELLRDCYRKYLDIFIALRNIDSIKHYNYKYFALTDSLFDTSKFMRISGDFQRQAITDKNKELAYLNLSISNQRLMLLGASIIILVIGIALIIILRQKRSLEAREESLFHRNIELINLEKKIEDEETRVVLYAGEYGEEKEEGELMSRIRVAMEDEDLWCDPEFDLNKLAAVTRSNTKYVSKAINDETGKNFRNFINEYRIRLACQRLSEGGEYLQMSIVALAESVGFKSPTSFNTAFKKQTGLSPSTFRKMSGKRMFGKS